jgi:hypothetical protein
MLLRYVTNDLVRILDAPPTCELAHMAASSDVLGRYDGPLSVAVPTRSILDLLEADRAIPLPARYRLADEPGGPLLHVVARRRSGQVLARLEDRAASQGIGLKGIVVHDDAQGLPARNAVRADLREHSFEVMRDGGFAGVEDADRRDGLGASSSSASPGSPGGAEQPDSALAWSRP